VKLLTVLLAAFLACGSALAQEDVEAIDRGNLIPSLRLSFDIAGEVGPRGPAAPHSGHGIELGLAGGSGEDSQSLSSGEFVRFGGRTFGGSTTLEHEFDFRFFEVAYRYRRFFGASQVFGIEALGGLGFAELEFSTRSATASATEKMSSGGLLGAFGIIWKFHPAASLHPRLTLFGSGEEEGVTAAARFDLHVAWAFARNVGIRGGLTSWAFTSARVEGNDSNSLNSRVTAASSGLSIGLDVAF
jgi:hypothetical protein